MILEAGMLLCWVSASVQHCGKLTDHDVFKEQSTLADWEVKISCKDGGLPHLERAFPSVSGLYQVSCLDGSGPLQEKVEWPNLTGSALVEYERMMGTARDNWEKVIVWWAAHPQCKHTTARAGSTRSSTEDLSGKAEGKDGWCSLNGYGPNIFWPPGPEDEEQIARWNPNSSFVKENRRQQALSHDR